MASKAAVIGCYRLLLRTTSRVFQGDQLTLRASYEKIRTEFGKNSEITDPVKVKEMLFLLRSIQLVDQGVSVATYLRQNVVQAVKTGDNVYRVKITEDTALQDNAKIELQ